MNDSMGGKPLSSMKLPTKISTVPKCIAPTNKDLILLVLDLKCNPDRIMMVVIVCRHHQSRISIVQNQFHL